MDDFYCECPDCEARDEASASLWVNVWGANGDFVTDEDDAALDRIIEAFDRHWIVGGNHRTAIEAVRREIASWPPRGSVVA